MTLIFDTSALSPLLSNDDATVKAFSQFSYDQAIIPLATDAEMRFGFRNGSKEEDNLANYELFKRQFAIEVRPPNQDTAIIYAELATWARKNGVSLSNNDIWIAAASVQVGGELFAKDKDFELLTQVRLA